MTSVKQPTLYPFVSKLFTLVTAEENKAYASWVDSGDAFQVWNPSEFSQHVLPKYFKHNNFCSFIRQLNIYGFHKVDTENWIFKHEDGYFMRGNQDYLMKITRRKQQKRAAPADDSIDMRSPKMVKLSTDSTPSTPVVTTPPSPSLTRFDDGTLSPTNMDMSPSPDSPTSIQNYLLNELNTLKRKNLTQENTMAWLIQELLKSKKEIEEMKRTVKQLSSDNDEYKRRQALDVIGFRQQELQASFVQPNHPLVSSTNERVYQPHQQHVPVQEAYSLQQATAVHDNSFSSNYSSEVSYTSQSSDHTYVNAPMAFQSPSQQATHAGQLAQQQVLQYHDAQDPYDVSNQIFSPVLHASSQLPHSGVHGDYNY